MLKRSIRYFAQDFMRTWAIILIILAATIFIADQGTIYQRYIKFDLLLKDRILISLFRVPNEIIRYFPLHAGFALIVSCLRWGRTGELLSLLCSGISVYNVLWRLMLGLVPVTFLIVGALSMLSAYSERERAQLLTQITHGRSDSGGAIDSRAQWITFSRNNTFVYANLSAINRQKQELYNVQLYIVDADNQLKEIYIVDRIDVKDGSWHLNDGIMIDSENRTGQFDHQIWPEPISYKRILDGFLNPNMIAIHELPGQIKKLQLQNLVTKNFTIRFSYLLSMPLLSGGILVWGLYFAIMMTHKRTALLLRSLIMAGFVILFVVFGFRMILTANADSFYLSMMIAVVVPVFLAGVGVVLIALQYRAGRVKQNFRSLA